MMVKLVNRRWDYEKECKVGFSWTVLFFNGWVPLLRGDFKWAIIMFSLSRISEHLGEVATRTFYFNNSWDSFVTINLFGVIGFLLPFLYNRIYINGLLRSGYEPVDQEDEELLTERGFFNSRFQAFYWNWVEGAVAFALMTFLMFLSRNDIHIVITSSAIVLLGVCLWQYLNLITILKEDELLIETVRVEEYSFGKRMIGVLAAISTLKFQGITRQDVLDFRKLTIVGIIFFALLSIIPVLIMS